MFPHRAESLIETIIALTVIVIATTAGMTLLRTSLVGNEVIGEKIVAINLAVEGIEAVRNLRDLNYLKFGSDPDNCWDAFFADELSDCPFDKLEDGASYSLSREFLTVPAFKWALTEIDPLDETAGWLSLYSTELNVDHSPELELLQSYGPSNDPNPLLTLEREDAFRRYVTIDYFAGPAAFFDVTSTVEWAVKGQEKSVSLTRTIANIY
jgi:type II secretory pathway pseudopilin PulG